MTRVYIEKKSYDIDGILFDKDGTLLDFRSLWIDWSKELIHDICMKANLPHPMEEQLSTAIGVDWKSGNWDVRGPLAIGTTQDLIAILAHQLYQSDIPWNEAFALVTNRLTEANADEGWKNNIKMVPGLADFLKDCQDNHLKLGVITSDDYDNAVKHLAALGIDSYFGAVVGGDQVLQGKPFPESAEIACEQMGLDPRRSLVIGDSDGDMILGRNIAAKASIGIIQETNETDHFIHADHMIHTYDSMSQDKHT